MQKLPVLYRFLAILALLAIVLIAYLLWAWLIQMGYGRAGFYGYDVLENLGSPAGLLSADRILPEFQHFEVGDDVPISAVAMMRTGSC